MHKPVRFAIALTIVAILSVPATAAAPRDVDPERPIKRIIRVIKKVLLSTTGDVMSPPTP